MTDAQIIKQALPRIADWYARSRRVLPWREEPTPYRVWISEIMLQQTRIEAVIPYYRRFLAELPDVAALAAVEEDRLLKLWEGLGYYSRARNLKRAAEMVMRDFGGELPHTAAALRTLPGIGDYTAGAIASIACGEAAALTTEGLMELGETVCIPNGAPKCELCPWQSLCRAHQNGTEENYPVKAPPRPRRIEERSVLLLRWGDRWAIRQREKKGLLAGLWEFPNEPGAVTEEELRARFPQAERIAPCGRARHVFTHVEWRMEGWLLDLRKPLPGLTWETAAEIRSRYSIPTALKAYLALIE